MPKNNLLETKNICKNSYRLHVSTLLNLHNNPFDEYKLVSGIKYSFFFRKTKYNEIKTIDPIIIHDTKLINIANNILNIKFNI